MSALNRLAYQIAARDAAWDVMPILLADTTTGEILYVSRPAANIFNYEPHELEGQTMELLVPNELRQAHIRWRQDATVPKTRLMGVGRQIKGRKKNGEYLPVHVGLTATRVGGRQIGIAFIIDLTGVTAQAVEESDGSSSQTG